MKVVSVINYKGGVGKTTITSNIAAGLVKRNYKVMAIDLDPQANLTFSYMDLDDWRIKYAENKTIKNWFEEFENLKFSNLILHPQKIKNKNFNLISSHIGLINTDFNIAYSMNSFTKKSQKEKFLKAHNILKEGISNLNGYDIVLIDCPPNFSMITRNAIVASDYYLIPVKLDYLSTIGIDELDRHIKQLTNEYNSYIKKESSLISPKLLGIVCNMISPRKEGLISIEQSYLSKLKQLNYEIFTSMLRENKTIYSEAPQDGIPVTMKNLKNQYTTINSEIDSLVEEFIERIGL
ncbi:MAG: ParA family protein [Peptostreptococcaceae bacterium]